MDENDQVVATAEGQEINQSVIENPVSEPDSIQTIPLNDEDIANLINNGYEQAKKICKTSYLIKKTFICRKSTQLIQVEDPLRLRG